MPKLLKRPLRSARGDTGNWVCYCVNASDEGA